MSIGLIIHLCTKSLDYRTHRQIHEIELADSDALDAGLVHRLRLDHHTEHGVRTRGRGALIHQRCTDGAVLVASTKNSINLLDGLHHLGRQVLDVNAGIGRFLELEALFVVAGAAKEVDDVLVVNLVVGGANQIRLLRRFHTDMLEDVGKGIGDDAPELAGFVPTAHRVGLASSRLTVRKYAAIVPFEDGLDDRRSADIVDFGLGGGGAEDGVEGKDGLGRIGRRRGGIANLDGAAVPVGRGDHIAIVCLLSRVKRSHSEDHSDALRVHDGKNVILSNQGFCSNLTFSSSAFISFTYIEGS